MFSPTNPREKTLNAISPLPANEEAERRARHLSVCQELIDLGMKLARAAANQALDAYEHPQPTQQAPANPTARTPDPNLTFTRLSSSVRQSVALEAQIAANAFARSAARASRSADIEEIDRADYAQIYSILDHANLSEAISRLIHAHPDRCQIHETLNDIIEDTLTAYPEDHLSTHFARLCEAIGIAPNLAKLPLHLASQLRPTDPPPNPPDPWPNPH